jgi:hypothetical protein
MAGLTKMRVLAKPQAIGPDTNTWEINMLALFIMMIACELTVDCV